MYMCFDYTRVVTSQNLVPAKFYKNLIQSTELDCNSGIL